MLAKVSLGTQRGTNFDMLRELKAVVVGDGFNTVFLQSLDDALAGSLAGFTRQLDQFAVAGLALVKAQDVSGATRPFDQIRFCTTAGAIECPGG